MPAIRVRLIAPSGYPHDRAAMLRGVARLRDAGCEVEGLEVLDRTELRFAGSDSERASDINALATRVDLPDIALVTRGGYGATRLLPHLNYGALRERLADASTLLVGHSDFTALQMALHAKSGLITFSGPLLADLGAESPGDLTWKSLWNTATSSASSVHWQTASDVDTDVQGPLWGGNLAVLCSLIGTPYFPVIDDGILFVEDIGEPPFRIERLLYQLHLSGVLRRQRALVLGSFSACKPGHRDNGYDLEAAFAQIHSVAGIPVIDGLPHGHGDVQLTLPFGAPARLHVAAGEAELSFSNYPHLHAPADGKERAGPSANP
ncbi:muramoyltetrapeptide carboxypeptidase [Rhodanobacter sp. L36]|uniref:muramoyltetrapeptide carboxypeptidase n=1 Tax=Rhodanobacter sp. L36 TaxID=1747221 RepID=UPI00131CC70E|nr:muramoyltetrapeptide carboxypeptidase [Rhodanobacter sp. L36]